MRLFWWCVLLWIPLTAIAFVARESGEIVFSLDEAAIMSTRIRDLSSEITRLNEKIIRLNNKVNDTCL